MKNATSLFFCLLLLLTGVSCTSTQYTAVPTGIPGIPETVEVLGAFEGVASHISSSEKIVLKISPGVCKLTDEKLFNFYYESQEPIIALCTDAKGKLTKEIVKGGLSIRKRAIKKGSVTSEQVSIYADQLDSSASYVAGGGIPYVSTTYTKEWRNSGYRNRITGTELKFRFGSAEKP